MTLLRKQSREAGGRAQLHHPGVHLMRERDRFAKVLLRLNEPTDLAAEPRAMSSSGRQISGGLSRNAASRVTRPPSRLPLSCWTLAGPVKLGSSKKILKSGSTPGARFVVEAPRGATPTHPGKRSSMQLPFL
jgi:hypothetical protein